MTEVCKLLSVFGGLEGVLGWRIFMRVVVVVILCFSFLLIFFFFEVVVVDAAGFGDISLSL